MGIDRYLACNTCKEFVDCHKWSPHEPAFWALYIIYRDEKSRDASVPDDPRIGACLVDEVDECPVVRVDVEELLREIARPSPQQDYIQELQRRLPSFVTRHQDHDLIVACDLLRMPWSWDVPDEVWTQWKEIYGFHRPEPYYPRNLIDDLGLRTWAEVLSHYQEHENWLLHQQVEESLLAIRREFEQRIASSEQAKQK